MINSPLIKFFTVVISGLLFVSISIRSAPQKISISDDRRNGYTNNIRKIISKPKKNNAENNSGIQELALLSDGKNGELESNIKNITEFNCLNTDSYLSGLEQNTSNIKRISDNLVNICSKYNNLEKNLNLIINDYRLPKQYTRYNKLILLARADLKSINTLIQDTKKISDFSGSDMLKKSLTTLLNKILKIYNNANFAYYRAQYSIKDTGSFIIGASGYIKLIGEENFLGLNKFKDKNIPLKVKIVPAVFSGLDISNGKCNDGYAVSFVIESSLNDFFTAREIMLTATNKQLTSSKKQSILSSDNIDAAYCVEKQGDGFRLRVPGNEFINNTADNITRDINDSGTFTFASGLNTQKFDTKDSGNFKQGRYGYLKYFDKNNKVHNINEQQDKLKLIPALYENEDLEICHPDLAFSIELIKNENDISGFNQVLSSNYFTILYKYKDDIDSDLERKNASFCIEEHGSNYKIKNFYGNYLKHDNANNKGRLTNNSDSGSNYNFFDLHHIHADYTQGEVGPFEIGKKGYIKLNTENDIKYIENDIITDRNINALEGVNTNGNNAVIDNNILKPLDHSFDAADIISSYSSIFAKEDNNVIVDNDGISIADSDFKELSDQKQKTEITADLLVSDKQDNSIKETTTKLISNISRPVKFEVIPPRIKFTDDICSENDVAVSLEITDPKNYLLTRDEWKLSKVNKYRNSNDKDTVFCIEQITDNYHIKDANGYFIDDNATGYTQNPDKYGKFNFVSDTSDFLISTDKNNNIQVIDNGPFNNNPSGFIKSESSNVFLNIKNLNDSSFYSPKVKVINLDIDTYRQQGYCTDEDSAPVRIIEHDTNNLLANYYGKLYFINNTIGISDNFSIFCLQKSFDKSYKLYSEVLNSKLYLSVTGNLLVTNVNLADNFTIVADIGDAGKNPVKITNQIKYNDNGFIKLYDKNIYINTAQFQEQFNNKSEIPIRFNVIMPVDKELKNCANNISLEDYYNPSMVLSYERNRNQLKMVDKQVKNTSKVFCLQESEEGFGFFKLEASNKKYIDKDTASIVTGDEQQAGIFTLVNRTYNDGISENAFLDNASGNVMMINNGQQSLYISSFDSGQIYLHPNIIKAQGFNIEPGLKDEYCLSLRAVNTNKYLIYDNNQFILTEFKDENNYKERATICSVTNVIQNNNLLYMYNNYGYFITNDEGVLALESRSELPINDINFTYSLLNKRSLIKQRLNYRDPVANLSCLNLAWAGKRYPGSTEDLNSTCPSLLVLRADAKNNVKNFETSGQCCSGVAYRLPRSTNIFDGGKRCRVDYDLICT